MNAWTQAELDLLAYLAEELGSTVDTDAFAGEFPPHFDDETLGGLWYVAISGGGEPDDVGAGVPYCGVNADGKIEGIWLSREDAQAFACDVHNLLPLATGTIDNLSDCRLRQEPRIERAVVRRAPDGDEAGGEVRVWKVEIDIMCTVIGTGEPGD